MYVQAEEEDAESSYLTSSTSGEPDCFGYNEPQADSEDETDQRPAQLLPSKFSLYHPYTQALMRVGGGYMLALWLALVTSIGISLSLQEAFVAFAEDSRHIYKPKYFSFLVVVVIPSTLVVLSIICSEGVTVCMDMIDRPPLPVLRSSVFMALGCSTERIFLIDRALTFGTLFSAWVPFMMKIIMRPMGLWKSWGQVAMLFQLVFSSLLVITGALAKLSCGPEWTAQKYWKPFLKFDKESDYNGYTPMFTTFTKGKPPGSRLWFVVQIVIAELLLVLVALLMHLGCFEFFGQLFGHLVECICSILLIVYLIVVVSKCLPNSIAYHFEVFVVIFALSPLFACFVDFAPSHVKLGAETSRALLSEPSLESSSYHATFASRPAAYPICSMRWGSPETNVPKLTVIDVLVFAHSVYSNAHVQEIVSNATDGTDLEGVHAYTSEEIRDDASYIGRPFVFEIPKAKLCVLAVRGTLTMTDTLADTEMWSTIKTLDMFNGLVPIFDLLPRPLLEQFASVLEWPTLFGSAFGDTEVWDDIVDFAEKQKQFCRANGNSFLVTGHSLGGGLAQIIAAKTRSQALVFSPIGVRFSVEHFDITKGDVMDHVVSVVPERDPVPKIDGQIGWTQHVRCNASTLMSCHVLSRTACELLLSCGDTRHRRPNKDMMSSCS